MSVSTIEVNLIFWMPIATCLVYQLGMIANSDTVYITKNILDFASCDSHTSETNEYTLDDKDLVIDEKAKELFFGYVLQLCYVIKFFGHFVETHNNKEENLKMIKKVYQ